MRFDFKPSYVRKAWRIGAEHILKIGSWSFVASAVDCRQRLAKSRDRFAVPVSIQADSGVWLASSGDRDAADGAIGSLVTSVRWIADGPQHRLHKGAKILSSTLQVGSTLPA